MQRYIPHSIPCLKHSKTYKLVKINQVFFLVLLLHGTHCETVLFNTSIDCSFSATNSLGCSLLNASIFEGYLFLANNIIFFLNVHA